MLSGGGNIGKMTPEGIEKSASDEIIKGSRTQL